MEKKASSFSGQIGFVLAAAGSAVGVGNLWRFPYLAAKDGGGLFLLVYLVLVLTFGFTLLTSDIAIGRRTKQSAIRAYETMRPKWKFLGILTFLVPVLIMTYYAVIGGCVIARFSSSISRCRVTLRRKCRGSTMSTSTRLMTLAKWWHPARKAAAWR